MTEFVPAARRRRFFAWIIDMLFMILLVYAIVLPSVFDDDGTNPAWFFIPVIGGIGAAFLFFFGRDAFRRGISPGKYVVGLQVRDVRDPSIVPGRTRLVVRNLSTWFWPVEAIASLARSDKRRFGDLWADTVVVVTKPRNWFVVVMTPVAVGVAGWMIMSFTFSRTDAHQAAIEYLRKEPAVIERVGAVSGYSWFPDGSISYNGGAGEAVIRTTVTGEKGSAAIHVQLRKPSGPEPWSVTGYTIE